MLRALRIPLFYLLAALWAAVASAQNFTVNLKEADIQELIKFVAEATDTTIVVDPAVKGKVKVVSSRPVSRTELYDLFLSILEVHGYTAVRSGGVVRVIQSKDARSAPVTVRDDEGQRGNDEYVTQVMRLKNISAAKLIPVLRPLVPQQAHMAAYAPSNAIIISDVASNIDRIAAIIERMDRTATQETEVIKLRYGVAEDVVRMLDQLNTSEAQQGNEVEVMLVADARTNSVLISADELERARMTQLIRYLDTPLEQSGNVKVIYLEYAKAEDIAEVLTKVMQNIGRVDAGEAGRAQRASETSATIEADANTNALIITAPTDKMAALEAVVARLDIRRAQVLVEAIIVEMEVRDGQDLGLQWLFANDNGFFGSSISADDARARNIAGAILPEDGGDGTDSGVTTGDFNVGALAGALAQSPGVSLGWGVIDDNLSMTVILNALKEKSNANILSTPSLLTLDNQEAYITVGQNVPFVTGSFTSTGTGDGAQNPFQTIERENVGITLKVTPHINEGDSVVLDISQEVSSLSNTSVVLQASDLITNERVLQTKVLAADGRVVVLGGLIKDDVQDASQKVPLLGDIPLLGRLFRNDAVQVIKTNLLIFIRPTIIRDDEQLAGATADKYRYIRDQQVLRRERGLMFLDDSNVPVLPEWEEQIRQLQEIRDESGNTPAAVEAD
ncbi:type II secretion system secretin GspD [Haliea sp.]|jgi:general secretion pathway protein D|uniref:type II secretion system secretin GspD n=1 Tax=Haliea TaxID=475794 RepID=UPI000C57F3E5|nr:type II secretion system secretin GspD [Haliea sp.]MAD65097.1 type II secretion system protein GspD [Haliea sp.]MAY92858.1 type II secretion system protein GspD [Haliea sp.]MBK40345.1 type II secretion system protein GspD [Haliea sp.]|tara:strand:+ start:3573 stop:5600 length:2028 start_codon:yes stop_codon:yes gene_type:complete